MRPVVLWQSRATVSRKVVLGHRSGPEGRIVVRPGPPGGGLVFHPDNRGGAVSATLDRARIEGSVLVIAEGSLAVRGVAPILAACAAAGICDADIELSGAPTEDDGAEFDIWRATLSAAAVDLFAERRTPLCPDSPVLVRNGRGMVALTADTDAEPVATRPRAGEIVLRPGEGIGSLPFGPAWQVSVNLLALIALLGVPLAAVVRARHTSLQLLHAAICRAAARGANTGPVVGQRGAVSSPAGTPAIRWPERQSPPSQIAHLL